MKVVPGRDSFAKYSINPHLRVNELLKIMKLPFNRAIIFSKGKKIDQSKTFEENNVKDCDMI